MIVRKILRLFICTFVTFLFVFLASVMLALGEFIFDFSEASLMDVIKVLVIWNIVMVLIAIPVDFVVIVSRMINGKIKKRGEARKVDATISE